MREMKTCHENLQNDNCSVQNLVEKYMPLKTLNLIVEVTEDSFNAKGKNRLREVASKMCD